MDKSFQITFYIIERNYIKTYREILENLLEINLSNVFLFLFISVPFAVHIQRAISCVTRDTKDNRHRFFIRMCVPNLYISYVTANSFLFYSHTKVFIDIKISKYKTRRFIKRKVLRVYMSICIVKLAYL